MTGTKKQKLQAYLVDLEERIEWTELSELLNKIADKMLKQEKKRMNEKYLTFQEAIKEFISGKAIAYKVSRDDILHYPYGKITDNERFVFSRDAINCSNWFVLPEPIEFNTSK